MDRYRAANRGLWDAWTRINLRSEMYDVEAFAAGRGRDLDPIAQAGPGDVRGKTLLHLQCHFGMDTLSWARRGAVVTGIELFGPGRCLFESNFPVDKMGIGWAALWNAFKRIVAGASAAEKQAMFAGTARRVYRLD